MYNQMEKENTEKFYEITSTCKDDIRSMEYFTEEQIQSLDDRDMERIASKLANDYCEQLYWSSLKIITEYVLESKL